MARRQGANFANSWPIAPGGYASSSIPIANRSPDELGSLGTESDCEMPQEPRARQLSPENSIPMPIDPEHRIASVDDLAEEMLKSLLERRQIPPLSSRYPSLDLSMAYQVSAAVRHRREKVGEQVVGRKIGF